MENIISNSRKDYNEILMEMILSSLSKLNKFNPTVIGPIIEKGVDYVNSKRLELFLKGVLAGKWNDEQLRVKISVFGDKEALLNVIKKQYDSEHKYTNIICGLIIHECLEKDEISAEDLNHIEFLLTLNHNDLKNYISTYYSKDKNNIFKISKSNELILIETTREKMKNYGYSDGTKIASIEGDIVHTSISNNLIKYLEKHRQIVEQIFL